MLEPQAALRGLQETLRPKPTASIEASFCAAE
jgi:hypothetical protein